MPKKKSKSDLDKIIKKYSTKLNLSDWDITLILSKEIDDGKGNIGTCRSSHTYKWAIITIYKDAFRPIENIEEIICHELCHCLTDPLYVYCMELLNGKLRTPQDIEDQREILTEWIAKVVR